MPKKMPKGIYLRRDGRYMWRFQYQKQCYLGYSFQLREAEQAMNRKKFEVMNGEEEKPRKVTLDEWFSEWMATYKINCKALTRYTYQINYANYLHEELGSLNLRELTTERLQKLLNRMAERYSQTILNTTQVLLSGMLRQAVRNHLIRENPMNAVIRPRVGEKTPVTIPNSSEEHIFLEAAKDSYYYPLYKLAALTGMRIGEVSALRWQDVDFTAKVINVRHTLDYTKEKGLYLETPKTRQSRRSIPLLAETEKLLLGHRETQMERMRNPESDWHPLPGMEDLVFTNRHGHPLYQACIQHDLNHIVNRLIRDGRLTRRLTFHTLRHCFATRCVENGMKYKTLQTILGHRNLSTTMDVYAHCLPGTRREELEKVQDAL
jgi:integrase